MALLTWELCDLEQNVLHTLDNLDGGSVVIPLNGGRRAEARLPIETVAAADITSMDTVLRVTVDGWTDPLFCGRVFVPDINNSNAGEGSGAGAIKGFTLRANDPFYMLDRSHVVYDLNITLGWILDVHTGRYYPNQDQSVIMWNLINDGSSNAHGIVQGTLAGASVTRTYSLPVGKEVAAALTKIAELDAGPDWDMQPVVDNDGTLVEFNTYYPRQGSDKTGSVLLEFGGGLFNAAAFTYQPSGQEMANQVMAIGAQIEAPAVAPAVLAKHNGSIATYGIIERVMTDTELTTFANLQSVAGAECASRCFPIEFFDIQPVIFQGDGGPYEPPEFSPEGDYWIGDTIAGRAHLPDQVLDFEGRVTEATITEHSSGGLLVNLTCAPEVSSAGITYEQFYVSPYEDTLG